MHEEHSNSLMDTQSPESSTRFTESPMTGDALLLPAPIQKARYVVGGTLVLVIALVVGFTYHRIEQQLQMTVERELDAILDENVRSVKVWLSERKALAGRLAEHGEVRALFSKNSAKNSILTELKQRFAPALNPQEQANIKYIQLSHPSSEDLDAQKTIPAFAFRTIRERGSSLWIEGEGAERKILAAGLSRDDKGKPRGVVVIESPAKSLSEQLGTARRRQRGETYAFDDEGRFDRPETTSGRPKVEARIPFDMHQRGTSEDKATEYTNDQGIPVVGAGAWLSEYGFGIATELDQEMAYRSIAALRQSFLTLVILVGSALLGFLALGRWTLRVREESLLMTRRLGRLARAIQPLSAALEHDPTAVVLVDADGLVVYANAASHRVLRVSETLLGQDAESVFENLRDELKEALMSGQDSIVAQGADNDGETLLISSRNLSIDRNPHALYMLRPITQQVRRQEIEHWKKLIRVLSHELNNALAPITSLLSSARKVNQMSHQDPRLGEIFESIAERTRHLVAFLEGYREIARLPNPAPRAVPWDDFLQGLASQKRFRTRGELPKSDGFFDPVQMERVLVNLLNNAYESDTPAEDVEVMVAESPGGHVIEVLDRGTGMPEAVLKQAMLPFFSTKRTGTGVGLALSREIVEAHGGQLSLANREGGGLIVSCFLPEPVQPPSRGSLSRVALQAKNTDEQAKNTDESPT